MTFKYKLDYVIKVEAEDEEEAEEKVDLFFDNLFNEEDDSITVIEEDSTYYLKSAKGY